MLHGSLRTTENFIKFIIYFATQNGLKLDEIKEWIHSKKFHISIGKKEANQDQNTKIKVEDSLTSYDDIYVQGNETSRMYFVLKIDEFLDYIFDYLEEKNEKFVSCDLSESSWQNMISSRISLLPNKQV